MRRTIIEIKQNVAIGNGYILEKGDVIEVIKEDESGVYGRDASYQYPAEGHDLTDETGRDNEANIDGKPFEGKTLEGDKKESVKRRKEMQGDGNPDEVNGREIGVDRPSEGDPKDPDEEKIEVKVDSTLIQGNYANPQNDGKTLDKGGGNDDAAAKEKMKSELMKNADFANQGANKEDQVKDDAAKNAAKDQFMKNNSELKTDITDSTGRENNRLAQKENRFYQRRLTLK